MIRFDAVTKQFPDGTVAVDELTLDRAHRPDHRARRALGLRQDDHAAHGQPDDRAHLAARSRLDGQDTGRDERGRAAPRHRLRHPARRAVPAPHRARQRRHRAAAARLGQEATTRDARAWSCSSGSGWPPSSASATRPSSPAASSSGSGVARALAADPPVMLMDEPFCAVDPVVREQLQDEFLRLQGELGKTIVFVTHDIDEAIKLGDQVAVLRVGGTLAQVAEPAYLLAHPADDFVADFVGRDRGYRALGFQEAPRAAAARRSPPSLLGERRRRARMPAWLLVVDDDRQPLGWVEPTRIGDRAVAEADLHRGGTVAREHGSLRPPSTPRCRRRAVAASSSTTPGVLCGTVLRPRGAHRHRADRPARARRVRPGARRRGRSARRRGRVVTWLADNWSDGARRSRWRSLYLAGIPLVLGLVAGAAARLGWPSRWSRRLPGHHHDDRAALHDPVAGAVRPDAACCSAPRSSTRSTSSSP